MTKGAKEAKKTKRTRVKDLPRGEKELSKDEQKKIKGGETLARKGSSKQETSLS